MLVSPTDKISWGGTKNLEFESHSHRVGVEYRLFSCNILEKEKNLKKQKKRSANMQLKCR